MKHIIYHATIDMLNSRAYSIEYGIDHSMIYENEFYLLLIT